MPPKKQHSREEIIDAAFEIARSKGLAYLSARAVAQRLNCSTSPIYSTFDAMQDIEDIICERSTEVMLEYQTKTRSGFPLLDLCLGYVLFAVYEKQLFRDMFLNKTKLSDHSREMKTRAFDELMNTMLSRDKNLVYLTDEQRQDLLSHMWTYSHGLAALLNIQATETPDEESIAAQLDRVITSLLTHYRN